jgi:hypothetical protein
VKITEKRWALLRYEARDYNMDLDGEFPLRRVTKNWQPQLRGFLPSTVTGLPRLFPTRAAARSVAYGDWYEGRSTPVRVLVTVEVIE